MRDEAIYVYGFGEDGERIPCWLAQFSESDCLGRLRKVHLIPKQVLKRAKVDPWTPCCWVPACGGLTGISGHHGEFDGHKLTVPRSALSFELEEFARENGLEWYLTRRFGNAWEAVA